MPERVSRKPGSVYPQPSLPGWSNPGGSDAAVAQLSGAEWSMFGTPGRGRLGLRQSRALGALFWQDYFSRRGCLKRKGDDSCLMRSRRLKRE